MELHASLTARGLGATASPKPMRVGDVVVAPLQEALMCGYAASVSALGMPVDTGLMHAMAKEQRELLRKNINTPDINTPDINTPEIDDQVSEALEEFSNHHGSFSMDVLNGFFRRYGYELFRVTIPKLWATEGGKRVPWGRDSLVLVSQTNGEGDCGEKPQFTDTSLLVQEGGHGASQHWFVMKKLDGMVWRFDGTEVVPTPVQRENGEYVRTMEGVIFHLETMPHKHHTYFLCRAGCSTASSLAVLTEDAHRHVQQSPIDPHDWLVWVGPSWPDHWVRLPLMAPQYLAGLLRRHLCLAMGAEATPPTVDKLLNSLTMPVMRRLVVEVAVYGRKIGLAEEVARLTGGPALNVVPPSPPVASSPPGGGAGGGVRGRAQAGARAGGRGDQGGGDGGGVEVEMYESTGWDELDPFFSQGWDDEWEATGAKSTHGVAEHELLGHLRGHPEHFVGFTVRENGRQGDILGAIAAVMLPPRGRSGPLCLHYISIYVIPRARRGALNLRIGGALVDAAARLARRLGASEASLGLAIQDQTRTAPFWIRKGFGRPHGHKRADNTALSDTRITLAEHLTLSLLTTAGAEEDSEEEEPEEEEEEHEEAGGGEGGEGGGGGSGGEGGDEGDGGGGVGDGGSTVVGDGDGGGDGEGGEGEGEGGGDEGEGGGSDGSGGDSDGSGGDGEGGNSEEVEEQQLTGQLTGHDAFDHLMNEAREVEANVKQLLIMVSPTERARMTVTYLKQMLQGAHGGSGPCAGTTELASTRDDSLEHQKAQLERKAECLREWKTGQVSSKMQEVKMTLEHSRPLGPDVACDANAKLHTIDPRPFLHGCGVLVKENPGE